MYPAIKFCVGRFPETCAQRECVRDLSAAIREFRRVYLSKGDLASFVTPLQPEKNRPSLLSFLEIMRPSDVAMLTNHCRKLKVGTEKDFWIPIALVAHKIQGWEPSQIALVLNSFSGLAKNNKGAQKWFVGFLVQSMLKHVQKVRFDYGPSDIALTISSLAKLRFTVDEIDFPENFFRQIIIDKKTFLSRLDVAQLTQGFSRIGVRDKYLFQQLYSRALDLIDEELEPDYLGQRFSTQQVSSICYSMLKVPNCPNQLDLIESLARHLMDKFIPPCHVTSIVRVFGLYSVFFDNLDIIKLIEKNLRERNLEVGDFILIHPSFPRISREKWSPNFLEAFLEMSLENIKRMDERAVTSLSLTCSLLEIPKKHIIWTSISEAD